MGGLEVLLRDEDRDGDTAGDGFETGLDMGTGVGLGVEKNDRGEYGINKVEGEKVMG
ncbi:predicted protein [Sclerotinia sclerotiorum 1980 UF-70]|uniref:Uncharacterized protein n=2 Tax=Sclerotinia sclerotiorum (strain ATCC 18683 / 1980 / Ss-1) TaxID=665079 RepID=A7EMG0_SCLS1|nr:predicted protein [Sclerotinia sclerotiorum 1980 UF-70]APA14557.1 hypothetical protein sscle_13g093270 [Sclerotinia sclerotiorum 1980 UF-70]EDO04026.1 predicted protein [Sclerotinia sclerotiorum 1980 UF-70]